MESIDLNNSTNMDFQIGNDIPASQEKENGISGQTGPESQGTASNMPISQESIAVSDKHDPDLQNTDSSLSRPTQEDGTESELKDTSNISNIRPDKKRLSGAMKRKLKKAMLAQMHQQSGKETMAKPKGHTVRHYSNYYSSGGIPPHLAQHPSKRMAEERYMAMQQSRRDYFYNAAPRRNPYGFPPPLLQYPVRRPLIPEVNSFGRAPKRRLPNGEPSSFMQISVKKTKKKHTEMSVEEALSYSKLIRVAIVPSEDQTTHFTEEQAQLIKNAILEGIDGASLEGTEPHFKGCYMNGGTMSVICSDSETKNWLELLIEECKPWEGASLKLVESKELSPSNKVAVWIPGQKHEEPAVILKRLKVQNHVLDTDNWQLINRSKDINGQQLVYLIDNSSVKTLGEMNFTLFFNFSKINFRYIRKPCIDEEVDIMGKEETAPLPSD